MNKPYTTLLPLGLVMAALLVFACSKISEGDGAKPGEIGGKACSSDLDCLLIEDAFCSDDGVCGMKDSDEGSVREYPMGRRKCEDDMECRLGGIGFCKDSPEAVEDGDADEECAKTGYCWAECWENKDCYQVMGKEGYICYGSEPHHPVRLYRCVEPDYVPSVSIPTSYRCDYMTEEKCAEYFWNPFCGHRDCYEHGFHRQCTPEGRCVEPVPKAVDFGEVDDSKTASDWVGMWASVMTSAVRNLGLPLVGHQDTVSIHYSLMRVQQDGDDILLDTKLCFLKIENFDGEELDTTPAKMVVPDAYWKNVAVLHHRVEKPPPLERGAEFISTRFWELRGAKLADMHDPLPTRYDYGHDKDDLEAIRASLAADTRIFDQDKDGRLAMTTRMEGILAGEIYSVQRWSTRIFGVVLDKDHWKAMNAHSDIQYELDSSNSALIYDMDTIPYMEHNRSYYRAVRLDNEFATCQDVLEMAAEEDSFIRFTLRAEDLDDLPNPEVPESEYVED